VAQIEATTDYTTLAEKRGFIVVYPVQSITANTLQCWNWFELINQARDAGEPALIAGATRMVMQSFSVDPKRVYVIGASAGGAMAVIMGATYPDLYAAVGVVVGCEFGGYPCSVAGGPDPVAQGARAYQAMGSYARRQPVIVFHGDTDTVVPPVNAQQLVRQWLTTNDWADDGKHNGSVSSSPSTTSTGQVPNGRSYEIDLYGAAGQVLLEHVIINGAGHAWPGGPASATFTDPSGPDATTLSYDFFLTHPAP
jgi:poly(hydroxyalkanoate) depolymerase family esterase